MGSRPLAFQRRHFHGPFKGGGTLTTTCEAPEGDPALNRTLQDRQDRLVCSVCCNARSARPSLGEERAFRCLTCKPVRKARTDVFASFSHCSDVNALGSE